MHIYNNPCGGECHDSCILYHIFITGFEENAEKKIDKDLISLSIFGDFKLYY